MSADFSGPPPYTEEAADWEVANTPGPKGLKYIMPLQTSPFTDPQHGQPIMLPITFERAEGTQDPHLSRHLRRTLNALLETGTASAVTFEDDVLSDGVTLTIVMASQRTLGQLFLLLQPGASITCEGSTLEIRSEYDFDELVANVYRLLDNPNSAVRYERALTFVMEALSAAFNHHLEQPLNE